MKTKSPSYQTSAKTMYAAMTILVKMSMALQSDREVVPAGREIRFLTHR